jgi:transmembrane sensor
MAAYSDTARDQAIAWFNRLQDPDFEEAGWVEFTDWLEAAAENRAAYDAVESVWLGFESLPQAQVVPMGLRRPRSPGLSWRYAAAAVLAIAVVGFGAQGYLAGRPAPVEIYRTTPQEVRAIQLSDGSRVLLDRGSVLKVAFERKLRRLELASGEANFAVAHDAARPFVVKAGEREVRVLGTEFDVLRQSERLQVTVTRGTVAVGAFGEAQPDFRLGAGDQLDQRQGQPAVVRRVEPGSASSWRNGVLIYRDSPLEDVAADLGRYLATPVRLGPGTETMNFSGVLRIADGQAMVDRLGAFLPLEVRRGPDGVLLSRKTP